MNFTAKTDDSDIRLTVDYPSDLKMLNSINKLCNDLKSSSYSEIVNILRMNKKIMDLNKNIARNEGYLESVSKENNMSKDFNSRLFGNERKYIQQVLDQEFRTSSGATMMRNLKQLLQRDLKWGLLFLLLMELQQCMLLLKLLLSIPVMK